MHVIDKKSCQRHITEVNNIAKMHLYFFLRRFSDSLITGKLWRNDLSNCRLRVSE